MLKKVLQASPTTFLVPLLREGISHYIKEQVTRLEKELKQAEEDKLKTPEQLVEEAEKRLQDKC